MVANERNQSDDKENRPSGSKRVSNNRATGMNTASLLGGSDNFGAKCAILNNQNKQQKLKQRFTVIKKLGKGTYGKVQLAINKETGQEVAIKTIKKTKIENEQDLQRVRREIQIMSSIEHPHIVHIYEVLENKDRIVLIMQYAPGGELYEYVNQSKVLDDSEARRLFRQIATAIFYCHQNKICHRDLKLENILLDERNNAKLADFGLSNVFDKSHQLKTFCGSPLYASPEIVQGLPYEGPEIDCWSLGVLLYTLVYGAMPFDGSNFKRLVKQISNASYYEPKNKSQASPLIDKLLCADPKKRATILDVCCDPWVNGGIGASVSSPRHLVPNQSVQSSNQSPTQAQPQNYTCLLKVARDMANLTPVNLDILLALSPSAMASTRAAANQAGGAPAEQQPSEKVLAPVGARIEHNEGAHLRDKTNVSPSAAIPQKPDLMMAVDKGGQTGSPVASYVVRDHPSPKETVSIQRTPLEAAMLSSGQQEKVQSAERLVCTSAEGPGKEPPPSSEARLAAPENAEIQTAAQPEDVKMAESPDEKVESAPGQQEAGVELCVDQEAEKQEIEARDKEVPMQLEVEDLQEKPLADDNQREAIEAVKQASDISEIQSETCLPEGQSENSEKIEPQIESEQQSKMAVDEEETKEDNVGNPKEVPSEQAARESAASGEQPAVASADLNMKESEEKAPGEPGTTTNKADKTDAGAKPKKVKKKIVVKKKKISKKEPEVDGGSSETKTGPEADEQGQQQQATGTGEAEQSKKVDSSGVSKPGRVCIPETFSGKMAEDKEQAAKSKTQVAVRRQSALIADVQMKLLQQQQNGSAAGGPSSAVEADQAQLSSVRVADKKSEFERRASATAASQQGGLSAGGEPVEKANQTSQSEPKSPPEVAATVEEPRELEYRREQVRLEPACEGRTIEPIGAAERHEAIPLLPRPVDRSEPITPTSHTSDTSTLVGQLDPSQLRARVDELGGGDQQQVAGPQEQWIERKMAAPVAGRPSLHIDVPPRQVSPVGGPTQQDYSLPQTGSSLTGELRPAPIARSYKKVTFRKDGTCVTESGKIYASKAQDGTVRRVERKSKVTHYPVEGGSGQEATKAAREEIVEETTVCDETGEQLGLPDDMQRGSFGLCSWPSSSSLLAGRDPMGHQTQSRQPRPLERLIMASSGNPAFATLQQPADEHSYQMEDQLDGHLHQRRHSNWSPSGQLNREDSLSSCSSGSTDLFDDLFETLAATDNLFAHPTRLMSRMQRSLFRDSPTAFKHPKMLRDRKRSGSSLGSSWAADQARPHSAAGPFETGFRRERRGAGSQFGATRRDNEPTVRCGSVEPTGSQWRPFGGQQRHAHRGQQRASSRNESPASGYESDAPPIHHTPSRPPFAAAPGSASLLGARGRLFGSSNLFARPPDDWQQPSAGLADPLAELQPVAEARLGSLLGPVGAELAPFSSDVDSLMQQIELEHQRLRQRFARDQGQIWKGSTPSLASANLQHRSKSPAWPEERPSIWSEDCPSASVQRPERRPQQQQAALRSESSSSHQRPPMAPRRLNQSSSSGTQRLPPTNQPLRASRPLEATPTRRNTANLSLERPLMSEKPTVPLAMKPAARRDDSLKQELDSQEENYMAQKRSGSGPHPAETLRPSADEGTPKAMWEERPLAKTWTGTSATTTRTQSASFSADNSASSAAAANRATNAQLYETDPEARIQNWLLDQSATSGNFSSLSSGSKSSASGDAAATLPTSSSGVAMELQSQSQRDTTRLAQVQQSLDTCTLPGNLPAALTKVGTAASSRLSLKTSESRQSIARQHFEQLHHSSSSHFESQRQEQCTAVTSTHLGTAQVTKSVFTFSSQATQLKQKPAGLASSSSGTPRLLEAEPLEFSGVERVQQQQIASKQQQELGGKQSLLESRWQSSALSEETAIGSPKGQEAGEQEASPSVESAGSRSSSSLLDQLRSKGYKSMISQRLVSYSSSSTSTSNAKSAATGQLGTAESCTTASERSSFVASKTDDLGTRRSEKQVVRKTFVIEESPLGPDGRQTKGNGCLQDDQSLCKSGLCNAEGQTEVEHVSDAAKASEQKAHAEQESQIGTCHKSELRLEIDEKVEQNEAAPEAETRNMDGELKCEQQMDEKANEPGVEDEDVREAKANIKSHLDRMRETDEFLKSLKKQENEQEQLRQQQLFLFNNLLISTKLNGLPLASSGCGTGSLASSSINLDPPLWKSSAEASWWTKLPDGQSAASDSIASCSGPQSAPIIDQSDSTLGGMTKFGERPMGDLSDPHGSTWLGLANPHWNKYNRPTVDPLEPVVPLSLRGASSPRSSKPLQLQMPSMAERDFRSRSPWRRCKSQLDDQFYTPKTRATCSANLLEDSSLASLFGHDTSSHRLPQSATISRPSERNTSSSFFQPSTDRGPLSPLRGRRSLSQVRYHHYRPTTAGWASSSSPLDSPSELIVGVSSGRTARLAEQPATSEYRSSFGPNLMRPREPSRHRTRSPTASPIRRPVPVQHLSSNGESDDDEEEKMSSLASFYSAKSYVPRSSLDLDKNGHTESRSPVGEDEVPREWLPPPNRRVSMGATLGPFRSQLDSADSGRSFRSSKRWPEQSVGFSAKGSQPDDEEAQLERPRPRRASEGRLSSSNGCYDLGENSRLSELEQRIQANKKRREQLLSGSSTEKATAEMKDSNERSASKSREQQSCVNGQQSSASDRTQSDRRRLDGAADTKSRESSLSHEGLGSRAGQREQQATEAQHVASRRTRPSRLESMEARIKRRSYCVRVSSPDRPNAYTGRAAKPSSRQNQSK